MIKVPAPHIVGMEMAKRNLPVFPGELHKKQQFVFDNRIDSNNNQHTTIIGGAFGGGKSIVALSIMTTLALKYSGSHGTVVRRTLQNCKETVMKDFLKFFRPYIKDFNRSTSTAIFHNHSQIVFKGENIKDDPELHAWKSFATCWFFIEQIEEISEKFYEMALARSGRWKLPQNPPAFVLASVNPNDGWTSQRFYDKHENKTLPDSVSYIPMLIKDNPSLYEDEQYMSKFNDMDEVFRKSMLDGDWKVLRKDDAWQLYPNDWINQAVDRWKDSDEVIDNIGVDVARGGEDRTTFALRQGMQIKEIITFAGEYTPDGQSLLFRLQDYADKSKGQIVLDIIGVGSSPFDYAKDAYPDRVQGFNASAKGSGTTKNGAFKFRNLKAKLFWHFRELLDPSSENPIALPDDPQLLSELRQIRWKLSANKIQVESKDDLKKRIKKSPDKAEACIISFYPEIMQASDIWENW